MLHRYTKEFPIDHTLTEMAQIHSECIEAKACLDKLVFLELISIEEGKKILQVLEQRKKENNVFITKGFDRNPHLEKEAYYRLRAYKERFQNSQYRQECERKGVAYRPPKEVPDFKKQNWEKWLNETR